MVHERLRHHTYLGRPLHASTRPAGTCTITKSITRLRQRYSIKQRINYYLDNAGYHTALFGKYLNSWPIDTPPPNWDEFAYFKNSNLAAYNGQDWNVDGTVTSTGKVCDSLHG